MAERNNRRPNFDFAANMNRYANSTRQEESSAVRNAQEAEKQPAKEETVNSTPETEKAEIGVERASQKVEAVEEKSEAKKKPSRTAKKPKKGEGTVGRPRKDHPVRPFTYSMDEDLYNTVAQLKGFIVEGNGSMSEALDELVRIGLKHCNNDMVKLYLKSKKSS